MTSLKIKRLDSPLIRDAPPPAGEPTSLPEDAVKRDIGELTHDAATPMAVADKVGDWVEPNGELPEPPQLGEPLTLFSTRLPKSLRRSLSELTAALRAREGDWTSQKALPEQEVLAVLVWLAGSPADPQAVTRLGAALDAYRARRHAAAAAALQATIARP